MSNLTRRRQPKKAAEIEPRRAPSPPLCSGCNATPQEVTPLARGSGDANRSRSAWTVEKEEDEWRQGGREAARKGREGARPNSDSKHVLRHSSSLIISAAPPSRGTTRLALPGAGALALVRKRLDWPSVNIWIEAANSQTTLLSNFPLISQVHESTVTPPLDVGREAVCVLSFIVVVWPLCYLSEPCLN